MTESVYKLEIFLPEDHFDPICQALWLKNIFSCLTRVTIVQYGYFFGMMR